MKRICLISFSVILTLNIFAQSIQIDGVNLWRFKGVQPIYSGDDGEVAGYYTYYRVEKKKKGIRTFEFALIDKDLSSVKKTQIDVHRWSEINNTVFNGKYFLVSFDDFKNSKVGIHVIDLNGNIVKSKDFPIEKNQKTSSTIYPSKDGKGFFVVKELRSKKQYGYSVEKIDNELNQIWITNELPEIGHKKVDDFINSKDRFVVWEEYSPKAFGKKIKPQIVCFDAATGKKIYLKDGYDGTSTILPNQLRVQKDGSIVMGGAYVDGEKYKNVNNTGIYVMKLDPNGKQVLYTKVNNKEKIQTALKNASKGMALGSKDKVFVEDLIIDGENIIVVSEMFSKNINATPKKIQQTRDLITGKFIGSIGSDNKMVFDIKDFILFKFNQKGDLAEIKPIKKENSTKITCWHPYSAYSGLPLAKKLSEMGWFDYGFCTENKSGEKVMICKNNSSARKPEAFTYSLNGDYATNKLNLKELAKTDLEKAKVGYFNTLKSGKGKVAIAYYQIKLKRITIALEDI
jgi:hypothetical protein